METFKVKALLIGTLVVLVFCSFINEVWADKFKDVPTKGIVTMLDLGANACIPCKMMAPILKKMEKKYDGKAAIIFIDVWKYRDQAKRFGIRLIPTQLFFDAKGKEVYRHEGFMSAAAIVAQLEKMGVD
jgi:thioredoxin 1